MALRSLLALLNCARLRRISRAVSLLATFAVAALFCAPMTPASAQTTIKVWLHDHPPRVAIDKAIVAEFEKANPDIKVQYDVIPFGEYGQKLLTAFASGSGPDVFMNSNLLVAQYQSARILAPVDTAALGYADEKALTSLYLTGFDGIRFQGKIYGLPIEVSNWVCYVNNTIWKDAGLDPDKDFPKTWEELPAIAEKLTKRDANGVPTRRGFDFFWPNRNMIWFQLSTMFHQQGKDMVDPQTGKMTFDTPAGQRAIQYLVDYVNKYRLGGPQYGESRADFLAGKLGMDCSFGLFGIPQMKTANLQYSIKPAPRWADAASDNGFDAYAFYMMVNARSSPANQKAAWKFARMYLDRSVELFEKAGLFVPRQEVMTSRGYTSDPGVGLIVEELKKAKFVPSIPGHDQVVDILLKGRDQMVQGGQPVATILPAINDEMNAALARARARAGQ
jgi:multiple sugar transport system substrate-binding protein